jgi:hypothetical protein
MPRIAGRADARPYGSWQPSSPAGRQPLPDPATHTSQRARRRPRDGPDALRLHRRSGASGDVHRVTGHQRAAGTCSGQPRTDCRIRPRAPRCAVKGVEKTGYHPHQFQHGPHRRRGGESRSGRNVVGSMRTGTLDAGLQGATPTLSFSWRRGAVVLPSLHTSVRAAGSSVRAVGGRRWRPGRGTGSASRTGRRPLLPPTTRRCGPGALGTRRTDGPVGACWSW